MWWTLCTRVWMSPPARDRRGNKEYSVGRDFLWPGAASAQWLQMKQRSVSLRLLLRFRFTVGQLEFCLGVGGGGREERWGCHSLTFSSETWHCSAALSSVWGERLCTQKGVRTVWTAVAIATQCVCVYAQVGLVYGDVWQLTEETVSRI